MYLLHVIIEYNYTLFTCTLLTLKYVCLLQARHCFVFLLTRPVNSSFLRVVSMFIWKFSSVHNVNWVSQKSIRLLIRIIWVGYFFKSCQRWTKELIMAAYFLCGGIHTHTRACAREMVFFYLGNITYFWGFRYFNCSVIDRYVYSFGVFYYYIKNMSIQSVVLLGTPICGIVNLRTLAHFIRTIFYNIYAMWSFRSSQIVV